MSVLRAVEIGMTHIPPIDSVCARVLAKASFDFPTFLFPLPLDCYVVRDLSDCGGTSCLGASSLTLIPVFLLFGRSADLLEEPLSLMAPAPLFFSRTFFG